jgi:hypothetical protein
MQVVHERCAGLDVHKKTVVACRIYPETGKQNRWRKEVASFGTMTHDLIRLAAWLREVGVSHVAMESTGVYWKPVYNVLETIVEVMFSSQSENSLDVFDDNNILTCPDTS